MGLVTLVHFSCIANGELAQMTVLIHPLHFWETTSFCIDLHMPSHNTQHGKEQKCGGGGGGLDGDSERSFNAESNGAIKRNG